MIHGVPLVRIEELSGGREHVRLLPEDVILHQLYERSYGAAFARRAGQQLLDLSVVALEPTQVIEVDSDIAQCGEQSDLLALGVGQQQARQLIELLPVDRKAGRQ